MPPIEERDMESGSGRRGKRPGSETSAAAAAAAAAAALAAPSDTADEDEELGTSDRAQFLHKSGAAAAAAAARRHPPLLPRKAASPRAVCAAVALAAALALALAGVAHLARRGLGLSARSPAAREAETRAAALAALAARLAALREPETRASAGGALHTSLTVAAARFEDGPIAFWTRAYEGGVPGPILRVQPGDVVHLRLENALGPNVAGEWAANTFHNPNNTNVHFHGMHVDPTGEEDNVFRVLAPGEAMQTTLHVPRGHPRGLFHYHPHYHGSVFLQMGGGMVGALVVDDDAAATPPEYAAMTQHVVALQEFRFDGGLMSSLPDAAEASRSTLDMRPTYTRKAALEAAARALFPDVQLKQRPGPKVALPADWPAGAEPPPISSYFTLNGQYLPRIEVRPRENRLLRLIHAGGSAELVLSVPGCAMRLAASDGIYLAAPRPLETLLVSPGARVDVILNCEPNEAAEASASGGGGSAREALRPLQSAKAAALDGFLGKNTDVYRGILAFVHVQGESLEQPPIARAPPPPALYGADASLLSLSSADRAQMDALPFVFEFSMDVPVRKDGFLYKQYTINHKLFDGTSIHTMVLGRVQEWVVVNRRYEDDTPAEKNHPFHLHTNAFQVVDMTHGHGLDYEVGDWRDTILVPTPGNVTIRFRPADFTGVVAAHCHILGHSDAGMIAGVDMVAA